MTQIELLPKQLVIRISFQFTVTTVPAFQVVLILTSFVLAWLEAWFLDGRVIPQERYALRHYNRIIQSSNERTPLLLPSHGNTESVFYSPYASLRGSDDGEDMVSGTIHN